MKLSYRILSRLSVALIVVLSIWAALFYFALMDEVNDEVDDALEDYSETIIIRHLAGEKLPSHDSGSNNEYFLEEVNKEYADNHPRIWYADEMVYIEEKEETEPARVLTTIFADDDDRYYKLTVATPSIEKHDLILAIWYWIMFLYGVLLLTILVINIWVFHRSMKPLYVLLEWLDQYTIGKENKPYVNPTDITEFRKLNDALNRSVSHNERIYEQQKEFIGNASHEMQTPIAICRNRLEMLMEDETLTERQLAEMAKIYDTLEHITKLNKSLLLISKIENGQYPESSLVDVNALLHKYMSDYQEVFHYKNIKTDIVEAGALSVRMNETLASILVTNLLKNAFVHNVEGGDIRIRVDNRGFVISNTAEGGALDGEQIFSRFYQGSKKAHSTGLGLAIAATICRLYAYELKYDYQGHFHSFRFTCR